MREVYKGTCYAVTAALQSMINTSVIRPVLYKCFEDMVNGPRKLTQCLTDFMCLTWECGVFSSKATMNKPHFAMNNFCSFPAMCSMGQASNYEKTNKPKKSSNKLSGKSTNFWEVGNNTNIYHPHKITINKQQLPQSIKSKCSKSFQSLLSVLLVKCGNVALNFCKKGSEA